MSRIRILKKNTTTRRRLGSSDPALRPLDAPPLTGEALLVAEVRKLLNDPQLSYSSALGLIPFLAASLAASGTGVMRELAKRYPGYRRAAGGPGMRSPRFALRFDIEHPNAVNWAVMRAGEMVVEINKTQRSSIRDITMRAFIEGRAPEETSRLVRQVVGLHSRYSNAVYNLEKNLVEQGMPPSLVKQRTEAYADRLLRSRARTIARTEILKSAAMGRYQGWLQARELGLIPEGARKRWISSQHGSCDICNDLHGTVVPLDTEFMPGVISGHAHPNCRCSAVLELP